MTQDIATKIYNLINIIKAEMLPKNYEDKTRPIRERWEEPSEKELKELIINEFAPNGIWKERLPLLDFDLIKNKNKYSIKPKNLFTAMAIDYGLGCIRTIELETLNSKKEFTHSDGMTYKLVGDCIHKVYCKPVQFNFETDFPKIKKVD